ncbi:MAG: hypothetical protein WKF83_10895 [Nocardioidaceae bacterium]
MAGVHLHARVAAGQRVRRVRRLVGVDVALEGVQQGVGLDGLAEVLVGGRRGVGLQAQLQLAGVPGERPYERVLRAGRRSGRRAGR